MAPGEIAKSEGKPKGLVGAYKDREKPAQIRSSNITAAKAVANAVRTSLGPRGMDKMIQSGNGEVSITNDGATILQQMAVLHPTAKMLVELSKAQDVEAGDGTTTVVIIAGALLEASERLINKGLHPQQISESFGRAAVRGCEILKEMSQPVKLNDREQMIKIASTSLNSKVVSQFAWLLAPLAVDATLKVLDTNRPQDFTLDDIKIVKKLGGTVEESYLVEGALFDQKTTGAFGGPTKVEKAKVALIQFQLSPPKTDMENQVIVSDYTQMDRVLKEERTYILNMIKQIKKVGCNVLLIQKSILRDAVNDLALHFLAKSKIMCIKEVERDQVEFICKSIGCRPIASIDHFVAESLGSADLVEEMNLGGGGRVVKITGVQNPGKAVSILLRGSNKLVVDESDRSLHDALCVLRCLVKQSALLAGGGAPEMEVSCRIRAESDAIGGLDAYCWRGFADALEIIPYTLAENAGLSPIHTVTELRNRHAKGEKTTGINLRRGGVGEVSGESVVQPLLVSTSALTLATECVRSILKIDDIVQAARRL